MANAADYLLLDTTQLLTTYKLRTRSVEARRFVAKNIAPNYVLSVNITPTISGITLTPPVFSLQPNEVVTVTVEYDTAELETLSPGTLSGALTMAVSAVPVVIPEIPTPPAAPSLPNAPRQIISRIQITPTNFTLSEIGETTQFNAILYVDDVPTPATFRWSLSNDLAGAFSISDVGVARALTTGVNKATVEATVITPTQYSGTTGLGIVASNVPVITPIGGDPVPTTGNLRIIVNGISSNIGANVTISGLNQSITGTTTLNNIPVGTYTITPNVVTAGGVNYNPIGGGPVYVSPGQNTEIVIEYIKQSPPDTNSIQIAELYNANGDILSQGASVNVGERITVIARTYKNGTLANIGDVQFTANNTQEGVQVISSSRLTGEHKATFTVTEAGTVNITAFNKAGGSVTGQINALRASAYTIRINAPGQLIVGQCSSVTAVVLRDGVETNIPVEIDVTGIGARIGIDPCGVPVPIPQLPPQPVFIPAPVQSVAAIEAAAQTGTAIGGTIVDTGAVGTSGGVSTGSEFDQIAFIDQGQNAI